MPNPFPILFLSMLAHLILRVVVGTFFLHTSLTHIARSKDFQIFGKKTVYFVPILALGEMIIGAMFVAGWYMQIAALVSILYAFTFWLVAGELASTLFQSKMFYFLLLGVSLSLFITGAGAFAFDLPI